MERRRNEIWFSHPKRAARSIKFVPYGKGLHGAGGVWGETDWFEFLDADRKSALSRIKSTIAAYLKDGFVIAKSKIIDAKLAEALRLPHTAPAKSNTTVAKEARSKATGTTLALLERPKAKTFEEYKSAIEDAKRAYLRSLDAATRKRLREFLYRHNDELAAWAARDPKIAVRARHVLPPDMLPKKGKATKPKATAAKTKSKATAKRKAAKPKA